jgi:hypothetical protein
MYSLSYRCSGADQGETADDDASAYRRSRGDMHPIGHCHIMLDRAVCIHDRTPANHGSAVNDRSVHYHSALSAGHLLVDNRIRGDDQRKGQGERLQAFPELLPRIAWTDLAQCEHGIQCSWLTAQFRQFAIGSETGNAEQRAVILNGRITEYAEAFQLPKNTDNYSCVPTAAEYDYLVHVLSGSQHKRVTCAG